MFKTKIDEDLEIYEIITNRRKRNETNKKMIGRGFVSEDGRFNAPEPARADKYLKLRKSKANKEKLLGGKLQIRSENENQVNNVKSQMITKK